MGARTNNRSHRIPLENESKTNTNEYDTNTNTIYKDDLGSQEGDPRPPTAHTIFLTQYMKKINEMQIQIQIQNSKNTNTKITLGTRRGTTSRSNRIIQNKLASY